MNTINTIIKRLYCLVLPLIVLTVQILPRNFSYILIFLCIPIIIFSKKLRKELLLIFAILCGYIIWSYASDAINTFAKAINFSTEWIVILSRFALFGYLSIFAIWNIFAKTNTNNFGVGNLTAEIRFPFIWRGIKDNVLQITIVFSLICIISAIISAYLNKLSGFVILSGVIFSIVNSILEELLWRGFILNRTSDLYGEKYGLIVMSLAFGFYHYSLGFSIPICLIFSLGGIYFGGTAIRSKGLLSPIIMHISMNLLFSAVGMIF